MEVALSTAWIVVLSVGAGTMLLKAAGPVLLGGRELPQRAGRMLNLLAPAVLSALVVTEGLGSGRALVVDERLVGVSVAAVALVFRAPLAVVIVLAAASTALVRLAL